MNTLLSLKFTCTLPRGEVRGGWEPQVWLIPLFHGGCCSYDSLLENLVATLMSGAALVSVSQESWSPSAAKSLIIIASSQFEVRN